MSVDVQDIHLLQSLIPCMYVYYRTMHIDRAHETRLLVMHIRLSVCHTYMYVHADCPHSGLVHVMDSGSHELHG